MVAATVLGALVRLRKSLKLTSSKKLAGTLCLMLASYFGTCSISNAANVTVVISGLGGSEDFTEKFDGYASAIADETRLIAQSPTDVMLLRGNASKKDIVTALFDAISTREDIDKFTAFFIGHGSFDGRSYKFNIPGPDITGEELAALLNKVQARQQLIIAATSSSGALLEQLDNGNQTTGNQTTGNRTVITATKNGREKTAVIFPEYMVEAITTPDADIDKNESISAAEIFEYANRSVEQFYETEKLLAPEHARLQGENAESFEVARYGRLLAMEDKVPEELITTRETLSNQITTLRSRKEDIDEDEYFDTLENLMLELAEVQSQIDSQTGQDAE